MRSKGSFAAFLVSLVVVPGLSAQDWVIEGGCSDSCRTLAAQPLYSLGGPGAPMEFSRATTAVSDSRGRVIATSLFTPGVLVVFDAEGNLEEFVDRPGRGPGEFSRVSRMAIGSTDEILLFDDRVSVFASDLTFMRTVRAPTRVGALTVSSSGEITVLSVLLDGSRSPRLHTFGPEGELLRSFAPAPRPLSGDDRNEAAGALAPDDDGGIWMAVHPRYELTRYVDGDAVQQIRRRVEWYQPWRGFDPQTTITTPPQPRVGTIWVDEEGLLWTASWIQDPAWEAPRDESLAEEDPSRIWDTMVEVLDPASGELVAQRRFDDQMWLMTNGLAYSTRVDVVGRVLLDIVALTIE